MSQACFGAGILQSGILFHVRSFFLTEKKAEKRAEKRAKEAARKLYERGNSPEDIAEILDIRVEEVRLWLGLTSV